MRENRVVLMAGTRGTGKTSVVKKLIRSSNMRKKLIVDTFDSSVWQTMEHFGYPEGINEPIPIINPENLSRWKKGIYRIASSDTDFVMSQIENNVNNALIVNEDATKYIGSRLRPSTKKLILDSKQKNIDFVFIFHSLASIPPELVRVSDFLVLFKTQEGKPSETKYPFPQIPLAMERLRQSNNRYIYETIPLS